MARTFTHATLLATGAAICALAVTTPALASFDAECRLIAADKQLSDAATLKPEDRIALAKLKELVASGRAASAQAGAPPAVYDFGSLFIAVDPAADKDRPFGTHRLTVATRIAGVTHTAQHDITSPRYFFSSSINSQITTRLVFFGASHLEIVVSGPFAPGPTDDDRVAFTTVAGQPDLEKSLCDPLQDSPPAK